VIPVHIDAHSGVAMEHEESQDGIVAIRTEHGDVGVEAEDVVTNSIDHADEDIANTEAVVEANLDTVEKTAVGEEETVSNYVDKADEDVTDTSTVAEANQEILKKSETEEEDGDEEDEPKLTPEEALAEEQRQWVADRKREEEEKIAEKKRRRLEILGECPKLLDQEDFLFGSVYLPAGGYHTREDGSTGFYIKMETYGGNLGFVPVRNKIVSYSDQLRKALDKEENAMTATGEKINQLKATLEDPELDEDIREELETHLKVLERRKRLEYGNWKRISKDLDEEEEKGTRVYYSLRDTEGRMVEKEDIYLQNVKPSKEIIGEEDKLTYEVEQKYDELYIDRPAQDFNIFTDKTRDDFKMIAFLEKKKERIVIEQEARKISYDLRMY